jgi:OTU domain-containing protein 5
MDDNNNINEKTLNDNFYFNEIVDVVNPADLTVMEGQITSIRGNKIFIHNFYTKKDEIYNKNDNFILKQWHPGIPFQIFNRIDFQLNNSNFWVEGIISDIDKEKNIINIRYFDRNKNMCEEIVDLNSERIAQIGIHTSNKFKKTVEMLNADEINKKIFKNKKFHKLNKNQENKFREKIYTNLHLFIKDVQGDGNCMFRAISDQIYGNEDFHEIIREKCMDYLLIEREFFEQFIEGGKNEFENYITMKRKNGVWGDDIELQAISEIYKRPIEIYSNSIKPLKTFHENQNSFLRNENENENIFLPIRLSYHGKNHYNSIVPNKENLQQWRKFRKSFIQLNNGEYEDKVLEEVKINKENKKIIEENEKARKLFMEKRNKYLDDLLDDIILEEDEQEKKNNNENKNINKLDIIMKQSELEKNEEDMINSAIKMSLENENKNNPNKNQDMDYFSIPSIQTALEFGFSLDDAIMAWSIYGDNQDLVLQYLYSMQEGN